MKNFSRFAVSVLAVAFLAGCGDGGGDDNTGNNSGPGPAPGPAASCTVTPSVSGGGGNISPSTAVSVQQGGSTSFSLTPDSGYAIDKVEGTCGGKLNGNTYTTNAITANCTVVAKFKQSGGGGNDDPVDPPVDPGDPGVPKAAYEGEFSTTVILGKDSPQTWKGRINFQKKQETSSTIWYNSAGTVTLQTTEFIYQGMICTVVGDGTVPLDLGASEAYLEKKTMKFFWSWGAAEHNIPVHCVPQPGRSDPPTNMEVGMSFHNVQCKSGSEKGTPVNNMTVWSGSCDAAVPGAFSDGDVLMTEWTFTAVK